MEPISRKILVEVTPQEYNQIISGGFNDITAFSTKELISELCNRGVRNNTLAEYSVLHARQEVHLNYTIREGRMEANIHVVEWE